MLKNLARGPFSIDQREQRGAATRAKLLDAAVTLFGDKGFKAVSVREIADHAATNLAAISYHFGDKSGLYKEAFKFPVRQLLAATDQLQNANLDFEAFVCTLYQGFMMPFALDASRAKLMMKMHHREMVDPSGMLEAFIHESAKPLHEAMIAQIHRVVDPEGAARFEPADAAIQRLSFIMVGMATDFYSSTDYIQAFSPGMLSSQAAIEALIESLVMAACAIVQAEKTRRITTSKR